MTNDLIAPVTSTRQPWTGISLAESVEGLVEAIRGEGWVDDLLAAAVLGGDVVATAIDPLGALLSNGIGWAMEYFRPLREVLDALTGMPDVVAAHAATWERMAGELRSIASDLRTALADDLPGWSGAASEAYQDMMAHNVNAIGGLGATASAMAAATTGAGGLVRMTRELVRTLIADLVTQVIEFVLSAVFGLALFQIVRGVATMVAKWTARVVDFGTSLYASLRNLQLLLEG
ncbi:WXG100 family type VII secretion target [Actinokineospora cianjurensis]|uniref:Outer membrane channel protein CpnT-like N-terminal domain-containing protein n=1 Tax=Actinokineospora cianjurensis TaxID=585224 RepID=A0A421B1E9_9PSEU|nr:WXG100 family type VII secretion target [Actinokineospora cianjurensis]RLK58158.1 hypothetical protein CLV68_4252 [Actinokineospora cianjurensis]